MPQQRRNLPGKRRSAAHEAMERWLEENPVLPKPEPDPQADPVGVRRTRLPNWRKAPVDDELDLHGYRVAEAIPEIDRFLERSHAAGLRKVLIVHGKGLHSAEAPVLKQAVVAHLRRHPLVEASGVPERKDGGSGAVWVLVRR